MFQMSGSTNSFISVQYRFNIAAIAPATVTLTINGATDQFANIACNAFTDTGIPTPDGTCTHPGPASVSPLLCTAAITTTGKDYVAGFAGISGNAPLPAPSAGWNAGSAIKGTVTEYQIQSSPGSLTPSFTCQVTGAQAAIIGFAVKP
jgi:hypothetical protein